MCWQRAGLLHWADRGPPCCLSSPVVVAGGPDGAPVGVSGGASAEEWAGTWEQCTATQHIKNRKKAKKRDVLTDLKLEWMMNK